MEMMPQTRPMGAGSSVSRRSGSGTRRYRTRAHSSQIDESLFGTPKLQSPSNIKQSETKGCNGSQYRDQSHSAPIRRIQPVEKVRIITKDLIRDLKIPSKDPSGMSIILPPVEMKRLTAVSRVRTKMEKEAMMETMQQRKEAMIAGVDDRKAQFHQADMSRKKKQAMSELEEEVRAEYLLGRAYAMRMEQEDEVKKLNELILGAQCHAMRDAQILEKKQIQAELIEEERRLDSMMEVYRRKAIETQEQIDELRKRQLICGKQHIINQIKERQEEQLIQDALKDQEGAHLQEVREKLQKEEQEALDRKREQQTQLQQEIMRINAVTVKTKEQRIEEERLADIKAMEYTHMKMEREAEYEAKQIRAKKEKEKEVARLWAFQERERDYKAEQDELRARRNLEATDREWRRKQKELAKKKVQDNASLKGARLQQVVHKEHLLSMEAGRARAEFERVLKAQKEAIAKQKEDEERQHQRMLHHAEVVRQQVRERELLAVAKRREVYKERQELDEEARRRRLRLDRIKEKKLKELKAAGLPEKYCKQVERKI